MSRSRRLLWQSALVAALGALSLATAPPAEASQRVGCNYNACGPSSEICEPSACFNCGPGITTICEWSWECNGYHAYCGYET